MLRAIQPTNSTVFQPDLARMWHVKRPVIALIESNLADSMTTPRAHTAILPPIGSVIIVPHIVLVPGPDPVPVLRAPFLVDTLQIQDTLTMTEGTIQCTGHLLTDVLA